MKYIDDFLNSITMYRLVLYYLIGLILLACVLSFLKILSYDPLLIILSSGVLVGVCAVTNNVFSKVFNASTNIESAYITALILTLLITPAQSLNDFMFLFWAGILAMATKYIIAIKNKHIFNPVAIAVTLTAIVANQSASWWVGNVPMFPFVFLGGLLIIRKIKREDMVFSFLFVVLTIVAGYTLLKGNSITSVLNEVLFHSPMFFFAFIMLTEPLTSPPTKIAQIVYGTLVGLLFAPPFHLGSLYFTPEMALIAGNVYSYLVSPKDKLIVHLKEKIQLTPDIYDFVFSINRKINFIPGQYMEWTLPHKGSDDRGERRYYTLASSPTEDNFRIGVKFNNPGSTYKKSMLLMNNNDSICAGQLAGDFVLPKNKDEKLVFIAGGIGITPFRSMMKYVLDKKEKRDIVLFYSNKSAVDIVYQDVFNEAQKVLGIKVIYAITDQNAIPQNWPGIVGRINEQTIEKEIPDYRKRLYYLSGPHGLVVGFLNTLKSMGIPQSRIKIDFFPGYA